MSTSFKDNIESNLSSAFNQRYCRYNSVKDISSKQKVLRNSTSTSLLFKPCLSHMYKTYTRRTKSHDTTMVTKLRNFEYSMSLFTKHRDMNREPVGIRVTLKEINKNFKTLCSDYLTKDAASPMNRNTKYVQNRKMGDISFEFSTTHSNSKKKQNFNPTNEDNVVNFYKTYATIMKSGCVNNKYLYTQCTPYSTVELIVYDLKPSFLTKLSGIGIFHSALLINSTREIAFRGCNDKRVYHLSGIYAIHPGTAVSMHQAYESKINLNSRTNSNNFKFNGLKNVVYCAPIGLTWLSGDEINDILIDMGNNKYKLGNYDLLYNNCNHFTENLLSRIGKYKIPLDEIKLTQSYIDRIKSVFRNTKRTDLSNLNICINSKDKCSTLNEYNSLDSIAVYYSNDSNIITFLKTDNPVSFISKFKDFMIDAEEKYTGKGGLCTSISCIEVEASNQRVRYSVNVKVFLLQLHDQYTKEIIRIRKKR